MTTKKVIKLSFRLSPEFKFAVKDLKDVKDFKDLKVVKEKTEYVYRTFTENTPSGNFVPVHPFINKGELTTDNFIPRSLAVAVFAVCS